MSKRLRPVKQQPQKREEPLGASYLYMIYYHNPVVLPRIIHEFINLGIDPMELAKAVDLPLEPIEMFCKLDKFIRNRPTDVDMEQYRNSFIEFIDKIGARPYFEMGVKERVSLTVAERLVADGMSPDEVAYATDLPLDRVQSLYSAAQTHTAGAGR
ncbi:MAG: hypothetical protein LBM77_04640 [Spirochaetaceae bacterium]|jgi:hypothetical protein|nr:hypothetical protein [Spirochaetaceae bacterium]